ncbi:MAG: hypothetical protein NPIRA03_29490 [Nitrospirales bacterium]|nr:MAG: hypothetical protein NPIRA03_29490 [Nitrospirales bacterium]
MATVIGVDKATISCEWMYRYIYQDQHAGVISTAPCVVRKSAGIAMARTVAVGVSPIKSRLMSVRR